MFCGEDGRAKWIDFLLKRVNYKNNCIYKQYFWLGSFFDPGGSMVEMLVRSSAGVYKAETLPEQGLSNYILKSRSSKTTTPINESGVNSMSGTRESSTDKKPKAPPSRKR